jgi:hypothetical protein
MCDADQLRLILIAISTRAAPRVHEAIRSMSEVMEIRQEVRDLMRRVPRAPEDETYAAVDDVAIDAFEKRGGTRVPQALRQWLHVVSGAAVGPGGLFGISTPRKSLDLEALLAIYPEWQVKQWLPVAGDGNGNYYVLDAGRVDGRNPILFVDTHDDATEPAYMVASELWHFLRFLLRKECGESGWPFERDEVIGEDPGIATFDDVPLPWQESRRSGRMLIHIDDELRGI